MMRKGLKVSERIIIKKKTARKTELIYNTERKGRGTRWRYEKKEMCVREKDYKRTNVREMESEKGREWQKLYNFDLQLDKKENNE